MFLWTWGVAKNVLLKLSNDGTIFINFLRNYMYIITLTFYTFINTYI